MLVKNSRTLPKNSMLRRLRASASPQNFGQKIACTMYYIIIIEIIKNKKAKISSFKRQVLETTPGREMRKTVPENGDTRRE